MVRFSEKEYAALNRPKTRPIERPRTAVTRQEWRCAGSRGCGDVLESWAAVERHHEKCPGRRAECVT